jgi:hypothetical protein
VKIRFQKTALTIGLVVSFSLVSCQKDSSIMPVEPVNTPAKASDDLIVSPGVPKKHTLTKFGKSNLTYYADGRLRSVTEGSAYNREYTYSGNTITAISYSNGQMAFKDTYLIDPATGRCFESTEVNYFVLKVPGNTQHFPTETRTWAFKYNNQGQLISCGIKKQSSYPDRLHLQFAGRPRSGNGIPGGTSRECGRCVVQDCTYLYSKADAPEW